MQNAALIPKTAVPHSKSDAIAWIQLARAPRVGPVTFLRLLRQFGDASKALAALPDIAASSGAKGYALENADKARAEYDRSKALGAKLFCLGTPDYPAQLAQISDPPPLFWSRGNPALLSNKPIIALVGARNASAIGRRMAAKLAAELGELGYTIISGLARGIDAEAHRAALPTGTIAITAGGIDNIYPNENSDLYGEIQTKGLHLTEMPIGLSPQARHFPRRNRIISGLAKAVVVIEGAAKSGSLITARAALDQGREVMAVPGHPMDGRAAGCNILIRDGAALVRSGCDIHEALTVAQPHPQMDLFDTQNSTTSPKAPPSQSNSTDLDTAVMDLLSPSPVPEDELIRQLAAPPPIVKEALQELDLKGKIARHPGGMIALAV